MNGAPQQIAELAHDKLVQFVLEIFHRTLVHYGLWFQEVSHQMGAQEAAAMEQEVFRQSLAIHLKRLAKILGFEVDEQGVPLRLKQMRSQELLELARAQAVNWLATDGVWFQKIETSYDMDSAKRMNDTCWTQYSPYEAERIKQLLALGENSGLEGLKAALGFRNYALVNRQTIRDVAGGGFVFEMNECRVQAARKRRGLPDYPCKSVGNVEYPYFAKAIDHRIETRCLGCPPLEHPPQWHCAWEFRLPG